MKKEVTINIPFTYILGDVGYHSGMELRNVNDCKNEVVLEVEDGVLNCDPIFMKEDVNAELLEALKNCQLGIEKMIGWEEVNNQALQVIKKAEE